MLCKTSLPQNLTYYIVLFLTFLKMKRRQVYREIIDIVSLACLER